MITIKDRRLAPLILIVGVVSVLTLIVISYMVAYFSILTGPYPHYENDNLKTPASVTRPVYNEVDPHFRTTG